MFTNPLDFTTGCHNRFPLDCLPFQDNRHTIASFAGNLATQITKVLKSFSIEGSLEKCRWKGQEPISESSASKLSSLLVSHS